MQVPIIINNRNRITYLRDLVDWLLNAGYKNIYILDNDSNYPPVLDYYAHTKAQVVYLKRNMGYMALWQTPFFERIKKGYYVYTDADLLPGSNCPPNLVYHLYEVLKSYPVEKCGPALRINDLPEHYAQKSKVLQNEAPFWKRELAPQVYLAPLDTTFALYKPLAKGNAEECSAVRVGGDLEFIHRPWYENSAHPDEETLWYQRHAEHSSVWYRPSNVSTS